MKAAAALLAVLALLGAAGLSSLQDDDFCGAYPSGTTTASSEIALWPPGWRCVYESPRVVVNAGSVPWFFAALGGEAIVFAAGLRRRTSAEAGGGSGAGAAARLAAATTAALAAVGACGLIGGFAFAFVFGCVVGVPLAWLIDVLFARAEGGRRSRRRSLTTALVAGLAVFTLAVLASVVDAVPAAFVVVSAVALVWRPSRA